MLDCTLFIKRDQIGTRFLKFIGDKFSYYVSSNYFDKKSTQILWHSFEKFCNFLFQRPVTP